MRAAGREGRAARRAGSALLAAGACLALAACRQDMHDAPSYEAHEKSDFFGDGRSARPQVAGTVARGQLRDDEARYTGKRGQAFVPNPLPVSAELLARGRRRFDIYCAPCHGRTGRGDGMIVQRGYRQPTSFHHEKVRTQADGYIFDEVSNGFGAMPDYAGQITVDDRWAIVAYVRALQLSQSVPAAELSAEARARLSAPSPAVPPPGGHP
jgi:mono/diheme cytochrome c family protein